MPRRHSRRLRRRQRGRTGRWTDRRRTYRRWTDRRRTYRRRTNWSASWTDRRTDQRRAASHRRRARAGRRGRNWGWRRRRQVLLFVFLCTAASNEGRHRSGGAFSFVVRARRAAVVEELGSLAQLVRKGAHLLHVAVVEHSAYDRVRLAPFLPWYTRHAAHSSVTGSGAEGSDKLALPSHLGKAEQ